MSTELWAITGTVIIFLLQNILGLRSIKKDIKDIKRGVELRKEENSILIDASEASLEGHIKNGTNGKCGTALERIKRYKNSCLENRA